ncbi:hypothetical protein [Leptospira stimsonii]|nr:hypothetical protein [Leptospira stimsonii]
MKAKNKSMLNFILVGVTFILGWSTSNLSESVAIKKLKVTLPTEANKFEKNKVELRDTDGTIIFRERFFGSSFTIPFYSEFRGKVMVIENEERNFFHCRTIFRYQVVIPDNDLDEIILNHKLKISNKDSYIKLFRDNKILSIIETIAGAILFPITITFGDWPYCIREMEISPPPLL